jgi:hypothetical protein
MFLVDESSGKILRYYMASYSKKWMFKMGCMPPAPTCFIKRSLLEELGFKAKESLKGMNETDF